MKLILVESPTKSKTLTKFLGKDYKILSTKGHIRDLPEKKLGVDTENFTPDYVIPQRQKKTVSELKKELKNAEMVILSTDPDREGEAISWHLKEILKLKDYQRVSFHEITKEAIVTALKNPTKIDQNLVNAQQARRILDRLVGYKLSPVLWKKIYRDFSLSAGRVQSIALRIVAEREKDIKLFKPTTYWTIQAQLKKDDLIKAQLTEINGKKIKKPGITDKEEAKSAQKELDDKKTSYKVKDIEKKEAKRSPYPPHTTSTLQQDASVRFNYSAKQTMSLAQSLYEKGLITYHRTDSLNLSESSKKKAKEIIETKYGKNYYQEGNYKSKKRTQEAHEAIRPTNPELEKTSEAPRENKLYQLIRQRFLASQMASATIEKIELEIEAKNQKPYLLTTSGQRVIFEGFMKEYPLKMKEMILPKLEKGDSLIKEKVELTEKETLPPSRYTEASLIKELEKHEIGRPSTYAPTIATIVDRNYVNIIEKKLHATDIGLAVNNLLVNHFPEIVDFKFTAKMEEDLDKIAEGKEDWKSVLSNFYQPFIKNIKEKEEHLEKQNILEETDQKCPDCKNGKIVIKLGRNGKFKACSNFPECDYTESIDKEKDDQNEIKEQFGEKKCTKCGSEMVVKQSRYGMFWGCSNYPNCKNIEKLEQKTGIKCPKCQDGEIIKKMSKRGPFYACNNYPKCKYSSSKLPEK